MVSLCIFLPGHYPFHLCMLCCMFINVFIVSIHRIYSCVARCIHRAAAANLPLAGLDQVRLCHHSCIRRAAVVGLICVQVTAVSQVWMALSNGKAVVLAILHSLILSNYQGNPYYCCCCFH